MGSGECKMPFCDCQSAWLGADSGGSSGFAGLFDKLPLKCKHQAGSDCARNPFRRTPAAAEGEARTSCELAPLRYVEDDESHVDSAVGKAHAAKLFANRRGASAGLSRIERSRPVRRTGPPLRARAV